MEEKGSKIRQKNQRVRVPLALLLGIKKKNQATCHNIYVEDLVQFHAGCVLAASVYMSPYLPYFFFDLVDYVLLVSSHTL